MHKVNDAIVHGGQIVLTQLPVAEGQHVHITVIEIDGSATIPRKDVQSMLRGKVARFEDPTEPMIATEDWEMQQ